MNIDQTRGNEPPTKGRQRAGAKNLTGSQVRLFREQRGWTQHQLAEAFQKAGIPISRDMIASIETQRCCVTDCQVVYFARVLGVSWKSLFPDKFTLANLTPPPAPEAEHRRNTESEPSAQNPSGNALQKSSNVCEITCKSVKITFRGPL